MRQEGKINFRFGKGLFPNYDFRFNNCWFTESGPKTLNPNSVTTIEKLHAKIRKFDTNENNINQKRNPSPKIVSNNFDKKEEGHKIFSKSFSKPSTTQFYKKPCSICLKRGQRWNNHSEDQCNFNVKEKVKKLSLIHISEPTRPY